MEDKIKIAEQTSTVVADIHKEIQPALYETAPIKTYEIHAENIKDLNAKILKKTLEMTDLYPELSKYIEEMPISVPNVEHPAITLKNLQAYYDSLNTVLNSYMLEHAKHNL